MLALFCFALGGLAICTVVLACHGGYNLAMAFVRFVQYELVMRPKTRYYMF